MMASKISIRNESTCGPKFAVLVKTQYQRYNLYGTKPSRKNYTNRLYRLSLLMINEDKKTHKNTEFQRNTST